jgi:hypothetical protein
VFRPRVVLRALVFGRGALAVGARAVEEGDLTDHGVGLPAVAFLAPRAVLEAAVDADLRRTLVRVSGARLVASQISTVGSQSVSVEAGERARPTRHISLCA